MCPVHNFMLFSRPETLKSASFRGGDFGLIRGSLGLHESAHSVPKVAHD